MDDEGFLVLIGTWRSLEAPCLLVVVYAPQDHHEKQILWDNLSQLIANYNNFSILLGDFNEVRFQSDRMGTVFDSRSASKFNNFIHYSGLSDLPLGGKRFTRMDNLGSKHSKIDRFLVSNHVIQKWPNSHVLALPREFSDHSPILLRNTSLDFDPIPFKLYNSWIEHVDFPCSRIWRVNIQQSESKFCCEIRAKIDCLDNKAEISLLSPYEVDSITSFVKQLADLEHHKVKDLKKKPKIRWATKGDENSRVFHGIINNRCNRSTINGLNIHGEWITNPSTIKNHIFTSFGNRFKEENRSRPLFTSSRFQHLTTNKVHFLDRPFSLDEIKEAVLDCGSSKAPGPDVFTFKFFKKQLTTIEHDVISYVRHFEVLGLIPRGCNSPFITLVPKAMILLCSKWRNWIHSCLHSAFASVLINGSPTNEFKIERGLRQGDPHSPFLFILAVEALNVALIEATSNNIFHGIKVGKDKLAYGLKVNFIKSKLYVVSVSDRKLNSLAATIGCLASQFPCIYLGLPIGAKMNRFRNWNPLVDSLGVYYFSTFKAPKRISSKLESIRRNFFWGRCSDDKKILWISWDKVIATRDFGGLGIGSLKIYNQAMLTKWWWRFYTEDNALWNKVVRSIYGPMGGLHYDSLLKPNSGPLYHIMKLKDELLAQGVDLPSLFKEKKQGMVNAQVFGKTSGWVDNLYALHFPAYNI
ncbi:RNA-directed DNA polymerase, eukaryota [Tanacetum coccineum]